MAISRALTTPAELAASAKSTLCSGHLPAQVQAPLRLAKARQCVGQRLRAAGLDCEMVGGRMATVFTGPYSLGDHFHQVAPVGVVHDPSKIAGAPRLAPLLSGAANVVK